MERAAEKIAYRDAERLGLEVDAGVFNRRDRLGHHATCHVARSRIQPGADRIDAARILTDHALRHFANHRGEARGGRAFLEL